MIAAAAGALACGGRAPRTEHVVIERFLFAPATLVVAQGDTVEWSNRDFVPHTATARDSAFDSRSIDGGRTWRVVARTPGRHAYVCVFHPNMQGTIEVRGAAR